MLHELEHDRVKLGRFFKRRTSRMVAVVSFALASAY